MIYKKLILVLLGFAFLFASCSDDLETESEEKTVEMVEKQGNEVLIKLGLDSSSRTALPQYSLDDIAYITLYYEDSEKGGVVLGGWKSVEQMKNDTLSFKLGTYKFTLTALGTTAFFSDTKEVALVNGSNNLTFSPVLDTVYPDMSGEGNLEITMLFTTGSVHAVTCGLYTLQGSLVPGYSDEALAFTESGRCKYSKNGVKTANYVAVFKFFADSDKTQLMGTYREYASIVKDLTSKSECVLGELGKLFSINFVLCGGRFNDNITLPGSYTRKSSDIALPASESLTRDTYANISYIFDGWYDNESYSGSPVTSIPSGSVGNKTFYAKWIEQRTIRFVPNLTGASIATETQTVTSGVETKLLTSDQLGLNGNGRNFFGWAKEANAEKAEYKDGDTIRTTENVILYAVWSPAEITGTDTTKDSDSDGLTDKEELEVYFTDPSYADTDGDGWTDGEEKSLYDASTNTFNPLIADTPRLQLDIAGTPQIFTTFTSSSSVSDATSESLSGGTTGSKSSSRSSSETASTTYSWAQSLGVSGGFDKHGKFIKIQGSVTGGGALSQGDSYTYSQSESSGWSQSWSNGKNHTEGSSKTVTGGTLLIPVKIKNPSRIAYTVNNLAINVSRIPNDCALPYMVLGTVSKSNLGTLDVGSESEIFTIEYKMSNPDTVEKLQKYSNGFAIDVSGYTITSTKDSSQGKNDFTEALTKVKAKTASIYIDYGVGSNKTPRIFNVSVKNLYNKDATSLSELYKDMTLDYVFEKILKFTPKSASGYETSDGTTGGALKAIYGITNKASSKDGRWCISHVSASDPSSGYLYPANKKLSEIKLEAGDEISIIYSVDNDEDGVPLHEELLHNTSDKLKDTDGDGISDFDEIYGWYKSSLNSKYSQENKVCTNPVLEDSDGDGINDGLDSDPLVPEKSYDTSLKSSAYSFSKTETFKSFAFDNSGKKDLGECSASSLYLDISPAYTFATLEYSFDNEAFAVVKKDSAIPLNYGKNTIYIKCTAYNGDSKTYTIELNSKFKELSNFNIVSDYDNTGEVKLGWANYSDDRCVTDAKKGIYGGYVLYVVRADKLENSPSLPLYQARLAESKVESPEKLLSFYKKLSTAELLTGATFVTLAFNKDYCFYVFAYTGSDTEASYRQTCIASGKIKTQKRTSGQFIFYAHYIEDTYDTEEATDSNYFWTVDSPTEIIDFKPLCLRREETFDFDCDDETGTDVRYYTFTAQRYGFSDGRPSKFTSKNTKELKATIDRDSDYSFTVTFNVKEKYVITDDRQLGTITAKFSYSSKDDKWTCDWKVTDQGYKNLGNDAKGNVSVEIGERTSDAVWELYNEEAGGVKLHWDMSWDYEE